LGLHAVFIGGLTGLNVSSVGNRCRRSPRILVYIKLQSASSVALRTIHDVVGHTNVVVHAEGLIVVVLLLLLQVLIVLNLFQLDLLFLFAVNVVDFSHRFILLWDRLLGVPVVLALGLAAATRNVL